MIFRFEGSFKRKYKRQDVTQNSIVLPTQTHRFMLFGYDEG